MSADRIFAEDFSTEPWWWSGFRPPQDPATELPQRVGTLIIGAGYAGTACALRLAQSGDDVLVLDAQALGWGASTRSGGQVTGGVNVGKNVRGTGAAGQPARLRDAADGLALFERLVEQHQMNCGYHRTGRIVGFWTHEHEAAWRKKAETLNEHANSGARVVGRDEAGALIGSDFYAGGMLVERAGHVQPAAYFGGLLAAARAAGARLHGATPVSRVRRIAAGYEVSTKQATFLAERVVFATNAYTGGHVRGLTPELRRGLIPVTTHMIATEALPEDLARSVIPSDRGVSESRRVLAHYRKSPDGTRLLFGGRASFFPLDPTVTAKLLHRALVKRFPAMADVRLTNAWSGRVAVTFDHLPHIGGGDGRYFVAGCQGSGVTMMTYLGHMVAEKMISGSDRINAFDDGLPPHHAFYDGTPWFMPAIGSWYQFQDALDRKRV